MADIVRHRASRPSGPGRGRVRRRALWATDRKQLIKLTHNEDPWREVSERSDDEWVTNSPTIPTEAMLAFFSADEDMIAVREIVGTVGPTDDAWQHLTAVPTAPSADDPAELQRKLNALFPAATA